MTTAALGESGVGEFGLADGEIVTASTSATGHGTAQTRATSTVSASVGRDDAALGESGLGEFGIGDGTAPAVGAGIASARATGVFGGTADATGTGEASALATRSLYFTASASGQGAATAAPVRSKIGVADATGRGHWMARGVAVRKPWTIGGIVAEALVDTPTPTLTRGETAELSFLFDDDDETPDDYRQRYDSLRAFADYANDDDAVATGLDDRGRPWFRERVPSDAPVDSLLVEVTPNHRIPDVEPFWAVIVSIEDQSTPPTDYRQLDFEFFILGTVAEYGTEAAVRDALEVDVSYDVGGIVGDALADPSAPTLQRGQEISLTLEFAEGNLPTEYNAVRDYLAYPQAVTTGTTDQGVPWFREQLPSIAPVNSQLVQVSPSARSGAGFEDFWALIVGGSEASTAYPNRRAVDVSLFVLGTTAEYATETDVRNALESEVI
ncbi:hypothetical protein [Halostella sp. PRR32]|uniref:hypothetical protein n=1 Tax=Halostella sp. PRR32 TaxID=3098147 RepID=UPI002B1D3072|nr:hypothetical protein [Halostella sp. PRR32]